MREAEKPNTWYLTGRYRYRRGLFGSLKLEVEERCYFYDALSRQELKNWRKAMFHDLAPLREMLGDTVVKSETLAGG